MCKVLVIENANSATKHLKEQLATDDHKVTSVSYDDAVSGRIPVPHPDVVLLSGNADACSLRSLFEALRDVNAVIVLQEHSITPHQRAGLIASGALYVEEAPITPDELKAIVHRAYEVSRHERKSYTVKHANRKGKTSVIRLVDELRGRRNELEDVRNRIRHGTAKRERRLDSTIRASASG